MPLRIAVAGFSHETNTFARGRTDLEDFSANGLYRGETMLTLRGTNTVVGGAIDEIERSRGEIELIPLVALSAIPGGYVTKRAVDTIEGEIAGGLARTRPDAVLLDLHGAMVTEYGDDGEAGTLRRVREVVGPDAPVIAVLDLHAHLSQEMVDLADLLLPYDTYPHVDNAERGAEGVRLLGRLVRGEIRPTSAFRRLPMMPPVPKQFSGVEPTRSLMERAFAYEAQPGVINVGLTPGYAYADIPLVGFGVVVTTNWDQALAERICAEMADLVWSRREEFRPETMTVEEAVHAAMVEPAGPVVLADVGDNPGGGTACDGTALLWALLDLGAEGACLGVLADQEAVDLAFAAGEGARLELALGGKTDEHHGYPIDVVATVRSLSDGHFVYEGPMEAGRPDTLGRTAVLVCEGRYGNTVEVIVCERRIQPYDASIFRSQGIEPAERKIVVVKSCVHFRSGFTALAARIIEVDTPGLTSIDFSRFPYTRLPRPIWPLDAI
jgi:microcystin degradation protein MlrC